MSKTKQLSRRAFLHQISRSVGGSAILAATLSGHAQAEDNASQDTLQAKPSQQKGYRLTPHIKTYYQLADF